MSIIIFFAPTTSRSVGWLPTIRLLVWWVTNCRQAYSLLPKQQRIFRACPASRSPPCNFARANHIPLDPDRSAIINFPNCGLYAPLLYAPAAAGIAFGRLIGLYLRWLFYLAQCFSALVVASLLAVATRRLPPGGGIFRDLAAGADGFTIAVGLLFTAEILRLRLGSCRSQ